MIRIMRSCNHYPKFAFIFFVSIAKPLVGSGPNVKICIPADAKPETKAGSMHIQIIVYLLQ